ncbi:hypothetical protein AWB81_00264 [Caballeronia arationis]|jgi:hypothetical protein|uniref:Uncharacterized protein n=1 Tax=Caballeronia arationis TaxID=1777142 RepID=A0A7Z7IE80_9BURK|nr:DUF2964 family protein [Caballeronia arationis]SAK44047.1 hypothetical protein AWB81_00264 [Caballeronia arationis]SOE88523.1 Protein of unknown function [Caballeronia arationis]
MNLERLKPEATPEQRLVVRNKLRVLLAAIGTLAAVVGIGIAVNGLLEFNEKKVIVGACVIVFSTVMYIVMLSRAS